MIPSLRIELGDVQAGPSWRGCYVKNQVVTARFVCVCACVCVCSCVYVCVCMRVCRHSRVSARASVCVCLSHCHHVQKSRARTHHDPDPLTR